jgi:hypothetical protein
LWPDGRDAYQRDQHDGRYGKTACREFREGKRLLFDARGQDIPRREWAIGMAAELS